MGAAKIGTVEAVCDALLGPDAFWSPTGAIRNHRARAWAEDVIEMAVMKQKAEVQRTVKAITKLEKAIIDTYDRAYRLCAPPLWVCC